MSQCGMDFQSIPLHIGYNSQHFELIQYVNGLFSSLPTFHINDPKITIDFIITKCGCNSLVLVQ
jgi:hypothetical protein